jgi:hypothetical protein
MRVKGKLRRRCDRFRNPSPPMPAFAGVGHRRGSPDKVVMVVDAKRRRPDFVGQWAVLGSNQ